MRRAWALVALLLACRGKNHEAPAPVDAPVAVQISGCAALAQGVCELPADRTIRALVLHDDAMLRLSTSAAERTLVEDGQRLRFVVPAGTTELRIGSWSIAIREPRPIAALEEARALKEKGQLEAADAKLQTFLDAAEGEDRARALSQVARVALARGQLDRAIELFRAAITQHRLLRRRSDEADDTFALVYLLSERLQRFADARALVQDLGPLDDYPDGAARKPYYVGTIALASGDLRTATRELRDARARAERLGLAKLASLSEQALALSLSRGGRGAEASKSLRALLARDGPFLDACARADLLTNIGWIALEEREPDAVTMLTSALSSSSDPCADPVDRANVRVNLALAAVLGGDGKSARVHVDEARRALAGRPLPIALASYVEEIEGRIALADGDAKRALARFDKQAQLAAATLSSDVAWRAEIARGQALEALGRNDGAVSAYRRAESWLDQASADVSVLEARDAFLGDRERSARLLVELLVRVHRTDEAVLVARKARARSLAAAYRAGRVATLDAATRATWESLLARYRKGRAAIEAEAEGDWRLSADALTKALAARKSREDELRKAADDAFALLAKRRDAFVLRPPTDGELHIVTFGGYTFATDAAGTLVSRDENPWEALREKIASAKAIRAMGGEDVHAALFDGKPLIERAPVVYALDLDAPSDGGTMGATVVADPSGDLPASRAEGDAVAKALNAKLLRGAAATFAGVTSELARVSLFHYAGHATFALGDPWETVLPLADGRLSIVDVLALPRAPSVVSLFACESGRAQGLGIAQAFVAAGSRVVIATSRKVPDALAKDLASELYGNVLQLTPTEVPSSLRRALLAVRARNPNADWSAFRAFVP